MEESEIGKEIIDFAKALRKAAAEYYLARHGDAVSPTQGKLLGYLMMHPGATSAEIQSHFHLVKSTASDLINGLVETGYLEYRTVENDKRKKIIVMTEKGEAHQASDLATFKEFDDKATKGVTMQEVVEIQRVFDKIRANIGGLKA